MEDYQNETHLSVQDLREELIKKLDENRLAYNNPLFAQQLFNCGLTVYSKNYSFDSAIYHAFSSSILNPSVSLHPAQLKVLKEITSNDAVVISAPTSFGKTFCVFEYIARFHPQNVVLIVPTLALAKEYQNTIIKNNKTAFDYKIYSSIDEDKEYDFDNNFNLFILTHEKAISNSSYEKLLKIDFLVIDEVYKLDIRMNDDRTLLLNVAFYYLTKKAKKYCLLAPFIKSIDNKDSLEKKPKMVSLDYSPVINTVTKFDINNPDDRFPTCLNLLNNTIGGDKKTLVYIPQPDAIAKFVNNFLSNEPPIAIHDEYALEFLSWARSEIHPSWSLVKAMEKGYLVHNGSVPTGIRDFLLSLFNSPESEFNRILCTSTLLEGVNTQAEYLIITKPSRSSMVGGRTQFSAFDFFNLVGRTGRLYKYYVGHCFYIKETEDPDFLSKSEAKVDIQFELTENTTDIDIQINSAKNNIDVLDYFKSIGITVDDFTKRVGSPMRLSTFKTIKTNYDQEKSTLIKNIVNDKPWQIINTTSKIIKCGAKDSYFNPSMIYKVLLGRNRTIHSIIDELLNDDYISQNFTRESIINNVLKIKNGYLEHKMLVRSKVVALLLENDGVDKAIIDKLISTINKPIEMMFKLNSPAMKMLRSIGIYESDLETIVDCVGEDFNDLSELKDRLIKEYDKVVKRVCFISKYEINNFVGK